MKKLVVTLMALAILLTLWACSAPSATTGPDGKETETAPQASSSDPFKIGFVMIEDTGNSYNIMTVMKEYCAERGYEFIYESANNDNEKTISISQNFITKGCDALFVYTVDKGTMATVQGLCDNANVHVAFTGLMEKSYVEICDNEHDQGVFGAEKMIEEAKKKWGDEKIDLIIATEATEVGDGNRIRMHEAFIPRLLQEYPYLSEDDVIWVDCALDLLKATSEISNHLSAHPDAKHILFPVFYNASGGQGAMNALKSAGREDQAIIVSYHISDKVTVDYLKNSSSTWVGSIYFPPESYVEPLFKIAMDPWAKGEKVESQLIYSAYEYVNSENISQYEPFPFEKE